jgi:hypothetical protein
MVAAAVAKPKPAPSHAAPSVPAPTKSQQFVTVACKVPIGVELQHCVKEEYLEEGLNGSRMRTRYSKVGAIHVVRGPAQPNGPVPRGYVRPNVVGGYALTPNVPADFWDEWLRQNADNPIVVNKMIFALPRSRVAGLAREQEGLKSGLEPMDPDGDPRMPKPLTGGVGQVTPADEMALRQPVPDAGDEGLED